MNYYEHHLGDYDGATSHLSWLEDCAYRRMLCLYYRTEAPLPADAKQVCRLVRATTKPEREAVEQVLSEFFTLTPEGWRNERCDEDIAEFHELEPEREAKRENAKERQRRARARRAELFAALRGHNIVPPYDTPTRSLETLLSRVTEPQPDTEPVTHVTRDDTATHTHLPPPTSHSQGKEKPPKPPKGASPAISLKAWIEAEKAAGRTPIPDDDPVFAYAEEVKLPRQFLALAWREFRHRYTQPNAKRYRDWRAVFRKAVRGNWLRLWFLDPASGQYGLTTVGMQAQRAGQSQQAQPQQEHAAA